MDYKIAIDPGHGLYTPGKRCDKTIDPNETREWWLNNRIAVFVADGLKAYTGYSLIRTDDPTGKTDVSRPERCRRANAFKADIFISLHANAAAKKFSGGGIVTYVCKGLAENGTTRTMQKKLYNKLIAHTGLKGDRKTPLGQYNYDVLVLTDMPAILCELGFMNSTVDTPIILTEEFARNAAKAIVEFLAERGKLKKVYELTPEEPAAQDKPPETEQTPAEPEEKTEETEADVPESSEKASLTILSALRYLLKLIIEWAKG